MRPYTEGESFYNIIQTAVPDFVEADYPMFIAFIQAYLRFLEQKRVTANTEITPEYGANVTIKTTIAEGGSLYESRKLLEYRDVDTTLDEFAEHFLSMFAKHFPQYTHITPGMFIRSLRQFYQSKGTVDSITWFFRVVFQQEAEVYFPREDILRASDGEWSAPITLKVGAPIDGHINSDVATYYVGQRIETDTGSALVESVSTYTKGVAPNQVLVNELYLRYGSILGTFSPQQEVRNLDSAIQVRTLILPVISGVNVTTGGSNYAVGDEVTFSEGPAGGGGYGANGEVSAVSNTAINGVNVISGGDGYIQGQSVLFSSTTGSGATGRIAEVYTGDLLLEDGSKLLSEDQSAGRTLLLLEDLNTIALNLLITPFVNATATVTINTADYGAQTGVVQMNSTNIDSAIEIALAATDVKPFMHPWVFTDALETQATLVNAAAMLAMTCAHYFSNNAQAYAIANTFDVTTNSTTSSIKANACVSDSSVGNINNLLYLKDFTGFNLLQVGTIFKQEGNGVTLAGTVICDGTANVVGNGTSFSTLRANAHVRFADGTERVVRSIANNTWLSVYGNTPVLAANTLSVIPVGTVTEITPQSQRFYGKIKSVELITTGSGYATPPAVAADSISGRAQELFYMDPSDNNAIKSAGSRIDIYEPASLAAAQDAGQVTKVKILSSGVNYIDANNVLIVAVHGDGRTGANATFTPILGSLTQYPGSFTSNNGFLSADKYLQDSEYYNEYTYVIRAAESFDRYKDILKKLIHPAGFKMLGETV